MKGEFCEGRSVVVPAESDNRGDAFWEGVTVPLGYKPRARGWRRGLWDCMSIRVHASELGTAMSEYEYSFLLVGNDDGRAHAVAVTPVLAGAALRIGDLGWCSMANTGARPDIWPVFPPRDLGAIRRSWTTTPGSTTRHWCSRPQML
jgi:hypothetical protein